MPQYVVRRVAEALNDQSKAIRGSRIGVLGVAYKPDVDDPRESPAFTVLELLEQRGAVISYNDPYIPRLPLMRHHTIQLESQPLTDHWLAAQDCLVIVTDHSVYDFAWIVQRARLIVDTRNATARCLSKTSQVCKA
jgi:UDP-N-acetyl-D-glucosamine dehydrogenase